jgi:hypothetical protein
VRVLTVVRALAASSPAFGGEDPLLGRPWYHQELTRAAAREAGWSSAAAGDLAWHAHAIDTYLFNPFRRIPPGARRRRARRQVREALVTLHFDDLVTPAAVAEMWERHTAACVAAVLWCEGRGDVAGARHAVGITLHALQDFYSHSTWVDDPLRRRHTWWEVPPERRGAVVTGSYLGSPAPEGHPHGDLALAWPWRRSVPVPPPTALGSRLLGRFVDLRPVGMSLDSRWLARSGGAVRGLGGDADADRLFDIALDLAQRTSVQWLAMLDATFGATGGPLAGFWAGVREARMPASARARTFDDAAVQPARIVGAGPYPPDGAGNPGHPGTPGWYLHVAGTGAPQVLGPLDALPQRLRPPAGARQRPVEVFAFRPSWPLRAGFVAATTVADDGDVALDHGALRDVEHPPLPAAPPAVRGVQ